MVERVDIVVVESGRKGDEVEGVSRALRWVEMVSSMLEREMRRKSRRRRGWKQNWGVNGVGTGGGWVIMS